jgi:hypothetical protein
LEESKLNDKMAKPMYVIREAGEDTVKPGCIYYMEGGSYFVLRGIDEVNQKGFMHSSYTGSINPTSLESKFTPFGSMQGVITCPRSPESLLIILVKDAQKTQENKMMIDKFLEAYAERESILEGEE